MDHREAVDLLPWYANQTLEEEEREALEKHLSQCGACRKRLEGLRDLTRSLSDLQPQGVELAPDFYERRLKPLVQKGQLKAAGESRPPWGERFRRRIQGHFWWILGPVAALAMLLAASSPYLLKTFVWQPPARLLLVEAPRPGIAFLELKVAKRDSDWPSIAVSGGDDYKRLSVALSLGPEDLEFSRYILRLFRHEDEQELAHAEVEAADRVELFLKVSQLETGRYVLTVYGKMDSEQSDPEPINIYPFEIIRE